MNSQETLYLILVLAVAALSIIYGFRTGFTRQIASLLGLGFGIVSANIFTPEFSSSFLPIAEKISEPQFAPCIATVFCASSIFIVIYWIFTIFGGVIKGALSIFEVGMFNRLMGAAYSLICYMVWLSLAFNIFLCFKPDSSLIDYERSGDGNLVATVLEIMPDMMHCGGAEEIAHLLQLREAAKIS